MQKIHVLAALGLAAAASLALVPDLVRGGAAPARALDPAPPAAPEASPPEPATGALGQIRVSAGLDRAAWMAGEEGVERFLVITMDAAEVGGVEDVPVDFTMVVDTSGSMSAAGKIDYARAAGRSLVDQLDADDRLGLVTFTSDATTHLYSTPVASPQTFYSAIDGMRAGGGTDVLAGLAQGMAVQERSEFEGDRRVIVLSDGQDGSALDALATEAARLLDRGVSVSAMGLGLSFDEQKLRTIAEAGGGRYHYVDDASKLTAMFSDELHRASALVARRVEVEVRLGEGVELVEVYGYQGYDGGDTAGGYQAFIGDMHGGQQRKVVARIRVPSDAGEREVAWVGLRRSADEGATDSLGLAVRGLATRREALVFASADDRFAGLAAKALTGAALDAGNRFWSAGDEIAAKGAVDEALKMLERIGDVSSAQAVAAPTAALRDHAERKMNLVRGTTAARSDELGASLKALGYME